MRKKWRIKMELLEFCKKIKLPEEAIEVVMSPCFSLDEYKEMKQVNERDWEEFCDIVLQKKNSKELFLQYYGRFACDTYEKYQEAGIDEAIFWETFYDITIWCKHCYREHGVYGIASYDWFWRFFKLKIFRFGSLEFEEMDDCISIHIPEGTSLKPDKCQEAIDRAYQWFGTDKPFICHSWMLFPGLKALLPEDSNIMKFQKRFEITKIDYNEREAEWRIFGPILRIITDYPENTGLQRAAKKFLLEGGSLGVGYGVLR